MTQVIVEITTDYPVSPGPGKTLIVMTQGERVKIMDDSAAYGNAHHAVQLAMWEALQILKPNQTILFKVDDAVVVQFLNEKNVSNTMTKYVLDAIAKGGHSVTFETLPILKEEQHVE